MIAGRMKYRNLSSVKRKDRQSTGVRGYGKTFPMRLAHLYFAGPNFP